MVGVEEDDDDELKVIHSISLLTSKVIPEGLVPVLPGEGMQMTSQNESNQRVLKQI